MGPGFFFFVSAVCLCEELVTKQSIEVDGILNQVQDDKLLDCRAPLVLAMTEMLMLGCKSGKKIAEVEFR